MAKIQFLDSNNLSGSFEFQGFEEEADNFIHLTVQDPYFYPEYVSGNPTTKQGVTSGATPNALFMNGLKLYLSQARQSSGLFSLKIQSQLKYEKPKKPNESDTIAGREFKGYGGRSIEFSIPLISEPRGTPYSLIYPVPDEQISSLRTLATPTRARRPTELVDVPEETTAKHKVSSGDEVALWVLRKEVRFSESANVVPILTFQIGGQKGLTIPNCVIVGLAVDYVRWGRDFTRIAVVKVSMQELVQSSQLDGWFSGESSLETIFKPGELEKAEKAARVLTASRQRKKKALIKEREALANAQRALDAKLLSKSVKNRQFIQQTGNVPFILK